MSVPGVTFPAGAHSPVDVYKAGQLAARMWRVGETVTFQYRDGYLEAGGPPVASTLAIPWRSRLDVTNERLYLPAYFAGLLPEGSRRRDIQRAWRVDEEDELGLLEIVGGDTIGDVQVVPTGSEPPVGDADTVASWDTVSFRELWRQLPGPTASSALPGVQPKMSARSRSLHGGAAGPVILKLPIEGWQGVLTNERFFMTRAADVGLRAAAVEIVGDRAGEQALKVTRFDRTVSDDGTMVRHPQEDASQLLGLRPGQKYDPDARAVVAALAGRCAAPRVAARDLFHQLVYAYAIGNNDVHAKNLSIRADTASGLWAVTPVYDMLHTWPYEVDHRFYPAIRPDGPHDAVTRRHWLDLAADIDLPERAARRIIDQVVAGVTAIAEGASESIDLPPRQLHDLARVLRRRTRDLQGG